MLLTQGELLLGLYQPGAHPSQRETSRVVIHLAGSGASRSPALVPGLPLPRSGRGRFGILRVPAGMPRGAEESRQAWDSPPTYPPRLPRRSAPAAPRPLGGPQPWGYGDTCWAPRALQAPGRPQASQLRYFLYPPGSRRSPAGPLVRLKGPALKRCSNSNKRESELRDRPPRG